MKKTNMQACKYSCIIIFAIIVQTAQAQWSLTGNAGTTPGTNFVGTTDTKSLYFKTKNSTRMVITSGGKVGIGTAAPSAKLQVMSAGAGEAHPGLRVYQDNCGLACGQITGKALQLVNSNTSDMNNGARLSFADPINVTNNDEGAATIHLVNRTSASGFGGLAFSTRNALGFSEKMRISPAGNVGIGTTNPAGRVTIQCDSANASSGGLNVDNPFSSGTNVNSMIKLSSTAAAGCSYSSWIKSGIYAWSAGIDNSSLDFKIAPGENGVQGANAFVIKSNTSRVGIGTNAPSTKFHVASSSTSAVVTIQNTADFPTADGLSIIAGSNSTPGAWMMTFKRPDFTILGIIEQNSVSSVAYNTTSDLRLKTNIAETKYGLNTVLNIKAMDYNYKDDLNSAQTGFIAQQLYEQFPAAVSKGGDDPKTKPWMIDYSRLTPVLVKAIQEQQKEIEAKDAKVVQLQNQVNELQQCVQALCDNPALKNRAAEVVSENRLLQNQPNPFNQSTVIRYSLSGTAGKGQIVIRDLSGNDVKSIAASSTDKGQVTVHANELAQGTYTYSLEVAGESVDTKLMVITK